MSKYKSSVLTCNPEDSCCPIWCCQFLKGSRATVDLLEVIATLDRKLAEMERLHEEAEVE